LQRLSTLSRLLSPRDAARHSCLEARVGSARAAALGRPRRRRNCALTAGRRSALHNAAEAGDAELLAKLLCVKGDDDFDPVRRSACGRAGAARGACAMP